MKALAWKLCRGEDARLWPAMLMESDIEFTNSDKAAQIAFSPMRRDCQQNKCVAHVAINLILEIGRAHV